jgi:hypothetical protein
VTACFGRGNRNWDCDGFISNLNGNQTKQNRSEKKISWKTYFANKGQIRILRVCIIAPFKLKPVLTDWQTFYNLTNPVAEGAVT